MTRAPDDPTEVLGGDDEEPTDRLEPGTGDTDVRPPQGDDSRRRGLMMLVVSILASLFLAAIYIAAGGTDYKPSAAADPCDERAWTDPGDIEEAAQQFALSAVDGAACDLGVSREELARALAGEESRQAFQEDQDLSDSEVEEALRAGLNRAVDDAENAGVINGLAATGLRAAVRLLPVDQMIPLIEDASGFLSGTTVDDLDGVIDGVIDSLGGDDGDSGTTGDTGETGDTGGTGDPPDLIPDGLGDQLEQGLRDQLPPRIERNLPDDLQRRAEQELDDLINP